jgi:Spy/CpxP family protein refolding chaperone
MKLATSLIVAGALVAGTTLASAQGASNKAPGQEMQEKGPVKGSPGASGYAPGHEMQKKGFCKGKNRRVGICAGANHRCKA